MKNLITAHNSLEAVEAAGSFNLFEKVGVTLEQVKASCEAGHYLFQSASQLRTGSRIRIYGANFSFYLDVIVTDTSRKEHRVSVLFDREKIFHDVVDVGDDKKPSFADAYEIQKRESDGKWFVFDKLVSEPLNDDLFNTKKLAQASLDEILETK